MDHKWEDRTPPLTGVMGVARQQQQQVEEIADYKKVKDMIEKFWGYIFSFVRECNI